LIAIFRARWYDSPLGTRKVRRKGRNGLILDGQLKMRPQIGKGRSREYCHTQTARP
jgi:hypothetical protein